MLNKAHTVLFACLGLFACTTPAHAISVDSYGLQYDSRDGTLAVTGIDQGFANYVIESESNAFLESDRHDEQLNHQLTISLLQIGPGFLIKVGTSASTPSVLSETFVQSTPNSPSSLIQGGVGQLGAVLPAGLSQSEFESAITSATYVQGNGFPIEDFQLVYVPEPASLGMIAIGSLVVLRRRRASA